MAFDTGYVKMFALGLAKGLRSINPKPKKLDDEYESLPEYRAYYHLGYSIAWFIKGLIFVLLYTHGLPVHLFF